MTDPTPTFADLGLSEPLTAALAELGYEEPTPIQAAAIPPVLAGQDVLGQAATGTGKTAAFSLPLLQRLSASTRCREPRGLVLVPTRELAVQVAEAIHRYGRRLGTSVLPVYGGQSIMRQVGGLKRGVDVVVATPGRAVDLVGRGALVLDHVEVVVLDEADEMLDMGFADDLDALLAATPEARQTVLFSATMPQRAEAIASRHLRAPVLVQVAAAPVPAGEAPRVREAVVVVSRGWKIAALGRLLDVEDPRAALVFCRTRTEVDELSQGLAARGYRAEPLHGGMTQDQRDRVMQRLRSGAADLLVATDVAARGLDVEHLTHVVNFDVPSAPEAYVHRIGRVGRAGREGVALTLAEPREHRLLRQIEHHTGRRLPRERLPTVDELRARRLEATADALRELLDGDVPAEIRNLVEDMTEELDPRELAAAALALAHRALQGEVVAEEIPEPEQRAHRERQERPGRSQRPDMARIWIDVGRRSGLRPGDLVGAIANEAGVPGGVVGSIDIAERFSLVEVDRDVAERVLHALDGVRIKGRRVTVRWARPGR